MQAFKKYKELCLGGKSIRPGQDKMVHLEVSERHTGAPVTIPVFVSKAEKPGPVVFVSAAIHGDELNGVGIVRDLLLAQPDLKRGALLLVPMINVFGVETGSRYLPDRRDLNRSFPGTATGSPAARMARAIIDNVVAQSDYGIDLHTAGYGRTNYPHIRADLSHSALRELAEAFGCEVLLDSKGDVRTMRSVATKMDCPTILLEAGEPLKIEPGPVAIGIRGILNVLRKLAMVKGAVEPPAYQAVSRRSSWLRSARGGLVRFHVGPGDLVVKGETVATIDNFFAEDESTVQAPHDGIIIGMATLPAVKPGDPLCHLARPNRSCKKIRGEIALSPGTLHRQAQEDLKSNVPVWKEPRINK